MASVYRRFPNKDQLILTLFQERFAEWERQAAAAADAEDVETAFVRYFEESTDALVRAPGEHMRMTFHDLRYAVRGLRRTPWTPFRSKAE